MQNAGLNVGEKGMEDKNNSPIIDLHSHVLPNMDDGSTGVQMSLQMLERLSEQGVETVCATSHYYARHESIEGFLERRKNAWHRLKEAMQKVEDVPSILLGAEVAYFPGISRCEQLKQLCLSGSRTLLLELSYTQWTHQQVEEVASLSLDHGYQIVLAHPERFSHMESYWNDLERMLSLPIALQVNADSLLHWRSRKLALELLRSTSNPLVASDCHNLTMRPPRLGKARVVIEKKLGAEVLARMDQTALRLTTPLNKEIQEVQA